MQRKYRRSLSAGANVSHSTPQRSSMSPYQSWQRITPQGSTRNSSPSPARYHPYAHHPRTPPATPDRPKGHHSPQTLPPLVIPHYHAPSNRSPHSAHGPSTPSSTGSNISGEHGEQKLLPDIHTVFALPSPSTNVQLPPLQLGWRRSLSEPGYSSSQPSAPSSPTPTIYDDIQSHVQKRMRLDSLLS